MPCAIAAQAPPNRLEADLAKAKADYDRDPSSADAAICFGFIITEADVTRGF